MATITITGNTYPVKDQLRALGGRWNAGAQGWDVPADKTDQARALVASAPKSAPRSSGSAPKRAWRPCGYPGCHPSYCDECDGKGMGARY